MRRLVLIVGLFSLAPLAHAQWRPFFEGAVFGTYASQAGPEEPENQALSTNWFATGFERRSDTLTILVGGRFSLEPLTIAEEGYPQLFQYISPQSGGPLIDHMRAHDLVQELAIAAQWRALRLYVAPVGEPTLGGEPHFQRASGIDFAEAPFAFDVQESFHVATRVITAGVATKAILVEGGVFHASNSTGRHTTIDDGDIDSWSARVTFLPTERISAQLSSGRLGDDNREVSSASVSYGGPLLATSLLWSKRDSLQAYGIEAAFRPGRSNLLARFEWIDRPAGVFTADKRRAAHATLGYIFDFIRREGYRAGAGINLDYHSSSKSLQHDYGHKPQGLYLFVRLRTDRATRRAAL